jgi:hypothetical protein
MTKTTKLICGKNIQHDASRVGMDAIRSAMDEYNECCDGVSGYSLLRSLQGAIRDAVQDIADRHGCILSDETAGSGSYYISLDRDDADGDADVSIKIRVADHSARYNNEWSFAPTDTDKSVLFGLATIERLCQ